MHVKKLKCIFIILKSLFTRGSETEGRDYFTPCTRKEYNPCGPSETFIFPTENEASMCLVTHTDRQVFTSALHTCRVSGQTLLELPSRGYDKAFLDFAQKELSGSTVEYWLGLKFEKSTSQYVWQSSKNRLKTHWQRGVFSPSQGRCVSVDTQSGEWRSRPCLDKLPFLCQNLKFSDRRDARPKVIAKFDAPPNKIAVGSEMKANCWGFVGTQGTIAFQIYIISEGVGVFRSLSRLNNSVQIHQSFKKRTYGGCKHFLNVSLAWYHNSEPGVGQIACFIVHGDSSVNTHCHHCGDLEKIRFSYINEKPELTVIYHEAPNIAHLGRKLKFICQSCVGMSGNVSWAYGKDTGSLYQIPDSIINPSFEKERRDCGVYVMSTINLPVSSVLNENRIYCTSFYNFKGVPTNERTVTSRIIETKYGPQKPFLKVDYSMAPNIVIEGTSLRAFCSACVGASGSIYWSVVDVTGISFGKDQMKKLNLVEKSREETASTYCGPHVSSTINLQVHSVLNAAKLVCRSYNYEYLYSISNSSKRFVVESLGGSGGDGRSGKTEGGKTTSSEIGGGGGEGGGRGGGEGEGGGGDSAQFTSALLPVVIWVLIASVSLLAFIKVLTLLLGSGGLNLYSMQNYGKGDEDLNVEQLAKKYRISTDKAEELHKKLQEDKKKKIKKRVTWRSLVERLSYSRQASDVASISDFDEEDDYLETEDNEGDNEPYD